MASIRDIQDELRNIAIEGRDKARDTMADPDLTRDGRTNRFANWGKQQKWEERIAKAEARVNTAMDRVEAKAVKARAAIIGTPTVAEQTLAELRYMRRADTIRAALDDRGDMDGTGGAPEYVTGLVANANPADLQILEEQIDAHYQGRTDMGEVSNRVRAAYESALRTRDAEYGKVAELADQTDVVRGQIEHLASGVRMATTEVNPAEGYLWAKMQTSVDEAGDIADQLA